MSTDTIFSITRLTLTRIFEHLAIASGNLATASGICQTAIWQQQKQLPDHVKTHCRGRKWCRSCCWKGQSLCCCRWQWLVGALLGFLPLLSLCFFQSFLRLFGFLFCSTSQPTRTFTSCTEFLVNVVAKDLGVACRRVSASEPFQRGQGRLFLRSPFERSLARAEESMFAR